MLKLYNRYPLIIDPSGQATEFVLNEYKNKKILIIGGAGGVGSVAIQLARFVGLEVVTTASRPESKSWVKQLGAQLVLDGRNTLKQELEKEGLLSGIDYVLNTSDVLQYWDVSIEALKPFGQFCAINPPTEKMDISGMLRKSLSFHFELMFTKTRFQMRIFRN